jgi:DUF4097 and DUF4098 domain-containing protein YvlB
MNGDTAMTLPITGPITGLPATGLSAPGRLRMTPARVLTLVIGVPLVLALIGWTGFGVVTEFSQASFPVSYAIPVNHGQLVASIADGNLTARPGPGNTGRLTGNVQYTLIRPAMSASTTASGTTIGVNCHIQVGNCGLNATLLVPGHTSVTLSTGGGDMTVSGTGGNVSLSSAGGDVAVSQVAGSASVSSGGGDMTVSGTGGNVSLSSAGGDVALSQVPGSASVSTGGGDLTASILAGRLTFQTEGGDVSADTLTAPYLYADSGGGDVSLVFTRPPGYLDIMSDGGNVTVVLPHGSPAYDVVTTTDGGNLATGVPTSSSASDKITINSGGGDISVTEAS